MLKIDLKVNVAGDFVRLKTVLTIAGSDSIGGAGIQADIKTITMHGVYATTAITAITAQNTIGVQDILEISPYLLKEQLDSIFTDIYPDAVKIGMVSSKNLIEVIAESLKFYKAKNIVVDPVMVSGTGCKLFSGDYSEILAKKLFPISNLVTPNLFEAEVISGEKIFNLSDLIKVSKKISATYDCNVLCKGGHFEDNSNDVLFLKNKNDSIILKSEKINNKNTHGTGCTLSSSIASNLALGNDLIKSVKNAKKYVYTSISSMLNIGNGVGPIDHMFCKEFLN